MSRNKFILHVVEVLTVLIISFFVWSNNHSDISANIAASYKNRSISTTFDGFKLLTNIDGNNYESIDAEKLYLRNISDTESNYKLYYVYSTTSTVNYKTLKLSLDDKIYDLSDMSYEVEGEYFLFYLTEGTIDPYTTIEYDARVWTTSFEGSLTSNFITK